MSHTLGNPEGGMLNPIAGRIAHYMDLLATRQKLVASNIANADTPGYQTKDIDFQFEFLSLARGDRPNVVDSPDLANRNDGNNVSLDREMRLLAETAMRFSVAESLLKGQIKAVRDAIQEGKNG
jgi:flagellar basal-body rod protein FlgB